MANDIFIDETDHDLYLLNGTTIVLCLDKKNLTRQRVEITLKTFMGEWFANVNFGTPYFQIIYGKNTKDATDVALKGKIQSVEGITELLSYESSLDAVTRKLTVNFRARCESGEIIDQEIVV